jgi:PKD repeat protein
VAQPVTFTVEVVPPVGAPAVRSVTLDFGDGSSPESLGALTGRASVAHAYEHAGNYIVTATVLDAADRRHVSSISIQVAEPEEVAEPEKEE